MIESSHPLEIPAENPSPQEKKDSTEPEAVISIEKVSKLYKLYDKPVDRLKDTLLWRFGKVYGREFWALREIDLKVRKGETVGILGRNGAGKSTLLQIIAGVLQPTEGTIQVKGRVSALLELGSGFNYEFTGRENVYMNGAILGFNADEIDEKYAEIVRFADIGQFIDQPVKSYSSGMVMRLAFAVASCVEPDVLIVDEALAVGDILFQAKCLEKINRLRERGTTTLFVTHDNTTFQNLCNYGYILENGRVFSEGDPAHVALQYYELMRISEHARQKSERLAQDQMLPEQVSAQSTDELSKNIEKILEKDDESEYRFGSGEARIVSFDIRNQADQETNAIRVGGIIKIICQVEIYKQLDHLAMGILFRNSQGQNLLGYHSYHENRIDWGSCQPGEIIEVTCEGAMLLNPGEYVFNIGIADHRSDYDFTSLDSRNRAGKITVIGPAQVYYGLVHTQPKFQIKRTRA